MRQSQRRRDPKFEVELNNSWVRCVVGVVLTRDAKKYMTDSNGRIQRSILRTKRLSALSSSGVFGCSAWKAWFLGLIRTSSAATPEKISSCSSCALVSLTLGGIDMSACRKLRRREQDAVCAALAMAPGLRRGCCGEISGDIRERE